ncbi:phosphomannomutase/phosphoglucomutase [Candidatus Woesearchaeota archaeon]|nr:phosphomannomutase/phosphoglucomutase [Candidatus Woesearchaeota archaeon]
MSNPFKAYDIRGIYPEELDGNLAFHLGKATATFLNARSMIVGKDARTSSEELYDEVIAGIRSTGCNVIAIDLVTTPQFYFSLFTSTHDGGIIVTASHNPKEYNGFKICGANADTIYVDAGLPDIERIIATKTYKTANKPGQVISKDIKPSYEKYFVKLAKEISSKYNILTDTGNGVGTLELDVLEKAYGKNIILTRLFDQPDGNFPHHESNPIKAEEYKEFSKQLAEGTYDFGIATDGDADRVTFWLPDGTMVPPDIIITLIGLHLAREGERVGFEVRTSRAVPEILEAQGIRTTRYSSGRPYIKVGMQKDGVIFAGERSAHYLYQPLHNTDSSLLTMMHLLHIIDKEKKPLAELVTPLIKYPTTGEINIQHDHKDAAIAAVKKEFLSEATHILEIDGVSVFGEKYFFNVRKSNTEPYLRFIVEGDTQEIVKDIKLRIERVLARV